MTTDPAGINESTIMSRSFFLFLDLSSTNTTQTREVSSIASLLPPPKCQQMRGTSHVVSQRLQHHHQQQRLQSSCTSACKHPGCSCLLCVPMPPPTPTPTPPSQSGRTHENSHNSFCSRFCLRFLPPASGPEAEMIFPQMASLRIKLLLMCNLSTSN